jgi:sulfoxide reductase heme-binding subunit YedZ
MVIGVIQNSLGADPARALALESGRWSLRFLLASLAITPCRELFKLYAIAPLRRTLGLYSLFYASVHLLVYILFLLELRWSEIGSDILERPYITVGFIAFIILFALGVTSPKAMVRKLGRRWKLLHRFVYLAVVLAVVHLTWILRTDLFDAVLYGSIAAILLLYRAVRYSRQRLAS